MGAKHSYIDAYPPPRHRTIIEPFAGGASYSHAWGSSRDVVLVEKYPKLAGVWRWLIHEATPADILGLPLFHRLPRGGVAALGLPPGADGFMRSWMSTSSPNLSNDRPTTLVMTTVRGACKWSRRTRSAVASAVLQIKHWRVVEGDYTDAPDVEATWFIDPPYQGPRLSRQYAAEVGDHGELGRWSRSRRGQVIACDVVGADWLPFRALGVDRKDSPSSRHKTHEAVWTSN